MAHRLLHEPAKEVPDSIWREGPVTADLLSSLQAEAANEDAEPVEDSPLVWIEQRVAPFESGAQGLVALQVPAAASSQQPEAGAQPCFALGRRHRPDPGRRQLDCQGQAVQTSGDLSPPPPQRYPRRRRSLAVPTGPARRKAEQRHWT